MLFGNKAPPAPPLVETDTVVPFHFKDDTLMKNVMLHFTQMYDDRLDAEMLRSTLESLIERHGQWRKLGARVRLGVDGKLNYHIPATFDRRTRPSVDFSHSDFNTSIDDHPVAAQLPRSTATNAPPQTFPLSDELDKLLAPSGMPNGIAHWLDSDCPLLLLRIVTFTDATFVALTWSHAVMDGVAMQSLYTAWTAVLEGREDQVPAFVGFDEDLLLPLANKPAGEPYVLQHLVASGLAFAGFAFNFLTEMLRFPSEGRYVCVPGAYVADLKRRATAEARAASTTPGEQIWLSEGDVLSAWWSQTVVSALGVKPDVPVAINNAMDIRDFADGKIPRGAMYMGNAIDQSYTFLSADELLHEPLAATALRTRRNTVLQRTAAQVRAKMALDRAAKGTAFLGPSNQIQLLISNWIKCNFFRIDRAMAVVPSPAGSRRRERATRPGQVAQVFFTSGSKMNLRNAGAILGQDPRGNWWILWRLRTSAWAKVERRLAEMGMRGWFPQAREEKSRL